MATCCQIDHIREEATVSKMRLNCMPYTNFTWETRGLYDYG